MLSPIFTLSQEHTARVQVTQEMRLGSTITIVRQLFSAGTIASPQLLEVSGIGLKSVLEAAGVQQVLELPVGENLQVSTS